ncbi:MAG: IPTL-CTERM sorting domain-containing protein [Lysobacterales bacterium]
MKRNLFAARACISLFLSVFAASSALAGVVTSTADSGGGSLRDALAAAASGETITFSVPLPGTIALASELPINQSVTIQGPGADVLTISNATGRVFNLDASAKTVMISGLHLTGQNPSGDGGAILKTAGDLTIDACLIDNSTTTGSGGAIRNSYSSGAGYYLTITNSTLAGNTAEKDGAISLEAGWGVTIGNSTIANNHANDSSGAIGVGPSGYLYIYNSTIAGNSATYGGGINTNGTQLTLASTIVANNTDGTGINDVDRKAGTFDATNSLFSETFVPADNVINGVDTNNLQGTDPQLGTLTNNGGPTPTLLPASTSPAIGAGANPQSYEFDQRGPGFPRDATGPGTTGPVDIGAVQAYFATTASFKVTKTFSDGNDAEVDATLTCNSGQPLEQTFTIAGGDPAGVTFVVHDIPEGGANCEVTESSGPAGYTTSMNGGEGCAWEGVTGGTFNCVITNEANPASFTVYKEWVIENGVASDLNEAAFVTVYCNNEILDGYWSGSEWYYGTWLEGNDSLQVTVDTTDQPAQCYAVEEVNQTGIESDDDCDSRAIPAGGSSSCTFTNTVFFEGIPTLSQWGLAILAVLTLGVGLVGFRRFA